MRSGRAADLAQRLAKAEVEKVRTAQVIDAFAALYHEHGSLSEELENL